MLARALGATGPAGLGAGPRLHGDVRHLRARRGRREHRHDPRRAEAGVTLLDTGDFYGRGHNELLIRQALGLATEQRLLRSSSARCWTLGPAWATTAACGGRNFLAYSLSRLGTDYVDLYRPARLDPAVPIEETVGAIADMVRPATCATSGCPKWARTPFAGPRRSPHRRAPDRVLADVPGRREEILPAFASWGSG